MCPRLSARNAESKSARTATTTRRRRSTLGQSGRKASKDRKGHPASLEPAVRWDRVEIVDQTAPRVMRARLALLDLLALLDRLEFRAVTVGMDNTGRLDVMVSYHPSFLQP